MSSTDVPHLIGTWPPPGPRLHRTELRDRWPHPDHMRRTFCEWAISREDPWGSPLEKFYRIWYYTYLRFFRA